MMTLEEAYKVTAAMRLGDHHHPTPTQRLAKEVIFREVLYPKYADKDGEVPPIVEPDFNEGWH